MPSSVDKEPSMRKTLAESIRETLEVISETSNLEFALMDLHRESNGQPTKELADEIAADYAGVTGDKIMASYPAWVESQKNKQPPAQDPEKAKIKAQWEKMKKARDAEEERQARIAAQKEAEADKRADHQKEIDEMMAAMESFTAPEGWTKEVRESDWNVWYAIGDLVFTNDAGNIKITCHVTVSDKSMRISETDPYHIDGDTSFKKGDKWYTFTAYDKHGASFMLKSLEEIPEMLETESKRAQAAITRKAS